MTASIKETNYRELHALKDGDIIQTQDAKYTIEGQPIGYGGSSILYAARKSDTGILYAIKEWFPHQNCTQFKRINGVIQPIKPDEGQPVAQMKHARKNLENEARISQHLFNVNTRTVPICKVLVPISITTGGETHTEVAAGIFSEQLRFDTKAKSLEVILTEINESYTPKERRKTRGLPNIYLTACLMEEVLRALQQVHSARDPEDPSMQGYYYGDLHPKNVFFAETVITDKHVGIAHLLDYGSSMVLDCSGKTEELIAKDVFSTDGYRPPETNKGGCFRLDKRADIYSAGCLLYRCVISKAKFAIAENKTSPVLGRAALSELDGKAIGCSGRALALLNSILDNATKEDPAKRFPHVNKMLEAIQRLKELTEPPTNLLPNNLSTPDFPISHSRDKELGALMDSIHSGESVFIYGVGGIGKTEVAIELARRIDPPKGAYLVHFQNSMRETILNMNFSGYLAPVDDSMSQEEKKEADYQERLKILREQYQDALIIIDNFDVPGRTLDDLRREPAYQDFLSISSIRKIYTTRYPIGRKEWEINRLPDTVLLGIMRHYCPDKKRFPDEQLQALINPVDGHTLTLILIAKTLEESWGRITPTTILRALKMNSLSQPDFPEVTNDQNRSYQQQQIYCHLKTLFNLSGMREIEKTVLSHASLLPRSGLNALIFEKSLEKKERKVLHTLVKRGWLIRNEESKIQIHPVIREVCKTELAPAERNLYMLLVRWMLPLSLMGITLKAFLMLGVEDTLPNRLIVSGLLLLCFALGRWIESLIEKISDSGRLLISKILAFGIPAVSAVVFVRLHNPNTEKPIWPGLAALLLWIIVCCIDHFGKKRT